MFDSPLSNLVTYNPFAISANATLDEAVHKFEQMGLHHWPVVDDDHQLVGILTDIDIANGVQQRCLAAVSCDDGVEPIDGNRPCLVEQIMTRSVITVDRQESPKKALRMLIDHRVHSLPVLDDGRLTAMLTTTDYLRELSYGQLPISRETVATCMAESPELIDAEATLEEIQSVFDETDANYLCAVEGDFPLGVLSRREVRNAKCRASVRWLLELESSGDGPISVASLVRNAPTVQPGRAIFEATGLMVEASTQAIAVVNRANRLLGVLSEDQILRALLYQDI